MDEQTRLQARELLLRSRIYRFTGLVFAVIGFAIFLYLYFTRIRGDVMIALQNPVTIAIILLPFLPAFIVSWMAVRTENKLMKTLELLQTPAEPVETKDGK